MFSSKSRGYNAPLFQSHQHRHRHQQQQHNHGIPIAPISKQSPDRKLYQPIIYVDCDDDTLDPLALPFGGGNASYEVIQMRGKNKSWVLSCTKVVMSICLGILAMVALVVAIRYIIASLETGSTHSLENEALFDNGWESISNDESSLIDGVSALRGTRF